MRQISGTYEKIDPNTTITDIVMFDEVQMFNCEVNS